MGLYQRGLDLEKKRSKEKKVPISKLEKEEEKNGLKVEEVIEPRKETFAPSKEYRTGIDRLYHLIEVSREVNFEEVQKIIDVEEEKLESWINILENQGLVNVEYPPTGGTIIRIKGAKEKEFSIKKFLHLNEENDKGAS